MTCMHNFIRLYMHGHAIQFIPIYTHDSICCLARQCSRISMLRGTMRHRNQKWGTFELASGSGPFLGAGLAELCAVAHFVLHAGWR